MKNPIVTIEMENGGVIKAELYPEIAPNTVRNFIDLIEKCGRKYISKQVDVKNLSNTRDFSRVVLGTTF